MYRSKGFFFIALGLIASGVQAQDAAALQQAQRRGTELFELDQAILAARQAGEEMRAFRRDEDIKGWIADTRGEAYLITFVRAGRDDAPVGRYRIAVGRTGKALGEMEKLDDLPLDLREVSQFRARLKAEGTAHEACSATYETLVLPEVSGEWSAYLMPRGAFSDVLLLGGSYRAQVSGDGNTVIAFQALASGCSVLPNPAEAEALRFDDPAGGAVNELHAYIGKLAGKPLYVNSGGGSWVISGGSIQSAPSTP